MKNIKFFIPIVLITIILTTIVINTVSKSSDNETIISSEWLKQSLINISELSVIEYNYTNVAKFEDANKILGLTVPFSQKYFIVAYDGKIKAGVDLNSLEIDINSDQKLVNIAIKNSKIISHEMFDDKLEIFDEQNAIFNPIQIEDFTSFISDQKEQLELEIIEGGLLVEADEKSKEFIKQFVITLFPEDYDVQVDFKLS